MNLCVDISINGSVNEHVGMLLGEAGEAFFVQQSNEGEYERTIEATSE